MTTYSFSECGVSYTEEQWHRKQVIDRLDRIIALLEAQARRSDPTYGDPVYSGVTVKGE